MHVSRQRIARLAVAMVVGVFVITIALVPQWLEAALMQAGKPVAAEAVSFFGIAALVGAWAIVIWGVDWVRRRYPTATQILPDAVSIVAAVLIVGVTWFSVLAWLGLK